MDLNEIKFTFFVAGIRYCVFYWNMSNKDIPNQTRNIYQRAAMMWHPYQKKWIDLEKDTIKSASPDIPIEVTYTHASGFLALAIAQKQELIQSVK